MPAADPAYTPIITSQAKDQIASAVDQYEVGAQTAVHDP
jgi:hypothetical protein